MQVNDWVSHQGYHRCIKYPSCQGYHMMLLFFHIKNIIGTHRESLGLQLIKTLSLINGFLTKDKGIHDTEFNNNDRKIHIPQNLDILGGIQ